jgi:hypothetical protein
VAVQSLRPRRWLLVAAIASAGLFAAGLLFTYSQSGWTWVSLTFAGITFIGVGGVVDVATSRIELHDDALECGTIWSRRRYPRAEIDSVSWEKGGGVCLKLRAGGWGKLPELGYNAQGLTNTVRAWLKRRHAEEDQQPG